MTWPDYLWQLSEGWIGKNEANNSQYILSARPKPGCFIHVDLDCSKSILRIIPIFQKMQAQRG